MRNAFADEMTNLSAVDPRVALMSGDIGNRLFDDFKRKTATGILIAASQKAT